MKIKTTVAALSILSVLSFGASAANVIGSDQAQARQSIGTVSVGGVNSSPMDMRAALDKKAEQEGASSYRIIEARTGDSWHATAELYK
ncbi:MULTISPECIES: peroxide/acid stress response protein YhcN [unclassified Enterobacter]|uniref:peroxide/acid stress response protein YhcN n=1 Tax=unclassified Enterobacter TaxID=2608935 RepID=UPI00296E795C|nr:MULTISPECIES: peroxide/acid stress response protein YhcN [unclassified Enterobacter]WJD49910.1 peroxide/acid stress response protein YhcN [Enterobacter sp. PGRG2]